LGKNRKFVKNERVGQNSKIWSKIENLVKNRKFGKTTKIWSKIELWEK